MIFIPKFVEDFVGKQYKISGSNEVYTAIGYGDNDANGNPYVVGKLTDANGIVIRTHRFKGDNVEFLP